MESWNQEELEAFFYCIREKQDAPAPNSRDQIVAGCIEELFWAYNSTARAKVKRSSDQAKKTGYQLLPRALKNQLARPSDIAAS
jgi:hypothetical protein